MIKYQHRHASPSIAIILFATTALTTLTGCSYNNDLIVDSTAKSATVIQTPAIQKVVGDYASSGYDKRAQGSDWVGVMVRTDDADNSDQINIKVRARSDVKKPTCHFDGQATLMGQDKAHGVIFQTTVNDSMAFFQFKDGKLTIDSQDKYALNQFCSGGGTLVGDYQKLQSNLELT
ncbi:hypothetical protein [Psychrobacter sp. Cmf 22.2]|uniref:hypothetical protein n=1 Tax=Psychrobacter sp. Cmf 22.2 TaxID=1926478 RepID=UPI00094717E4|nr:hypothetical protein [Psychrobacter sp. Cmf 22.2]OLF38509.1 hypothetical protein BTV98_06720 [Psychrobacter sp. Cmf 22.2]